MTFTKAIGISWGKVAVPHPSLISANRSFGEITTFCVPPREQFPLVIRIE